MTIQRFSKQRRSSNKLIINYPSKHSEAEIVFYLYDHFKKKNVDIRAEVSSYDSKSRFDLVIFKDNAPQRIIEVKASRKSKVTREQREKYKSYGIPLDIVCGIKQAKEYVGKIDSKVLDAPIIKANKKRKVREEGDLCIHCDGIVVKREGGQNIKPGQKYYYAYYLQCPECGSFYMSKKDIKSLKGKAA